MVQMSLLTAGPRFWSSIDPSDPISRSQQLLGFIRDFANRRMLGNVRYQVVPPCSLRAHFLLRLANHRGVAVVHTRAT